MPMPMPAHLRGKSVPPSATSLRRSEVKVLTMSFHLSSSAVRPPATIRPVAGHITQRRVSR